MTLLLRPATLADADAIAAHRYPDGEDAAARPAYAAWVREALVSGDYLGLLAEMDFEVVAGAGLVLLNWGPGRHDLSPIRARLVNVWTHEHHRRQGLARQLTGELLAQARARGIGVVSLAHTGMSRPLYESLGFRAYPQEMLLKLEAT